MQYALLIYGRPSPESLNEPVKGPIAELLAEPFVRGWARLHADGSATTLRKDEGPALLTDGPFVESTEYLAGLIVIEAADIDEALAIADRFADTRERSDGAIEVRPIAEGLFGGA